MQIHLDGPRSHAEKLMESPFNLAERRKAYAANKQRQTECVTLMPIKHIEESEGEREREREYTPASER